MLYYAMYSFTSMDDGPNKAIFENKEIQDD